MKRVNVVLDEKLLEAARIVTGERTYSATISKALQRIVKQKRFRDALRRFEEEAAKGDFFWPGYLEEIRPHAYSVVKARKKISAHDKRAPVKKRGTR